MFKRYLAIGLLATVFLTVLLLATIPVESLAPYDPWLDYNDDGKIDARDVSPVSAAYGAKGASIEKAYMAYDSGWINITDKQGQEIVIWHGLNSSDVMIDITGKTTAEGEQHQRHLRFAYETTALNKTYGVANSEDARALVQTSDGGYALAGDTYSYATGESDFWLVKTDASGNALWNKTYGGTNWDYAHALVQTSDGGYALAGTTFSYGAGSSDSWLVKTDASGNALWNKTYGGTNGDMASALVQTADGGYALAGYTWSFGAGSSDFWLIKTDASGNALWNQTYGETGDDRAYALVQTSDGGYALAGDTSSYGAVEWDFWLVKTDASGNALWNKTYGETYMDEAYALVQTSDGGYALAGTTYSFGGRHRFWLIRTDVYGDAMWNKTYGKQYFDEEAHALVQTSDGGYALAGNTIDFYGTGDSNFQFVKTDASGNAMWNKTYGGTGWDTAYALVQTNDGGYAMAGSTNSYGAVNGDFWLVKTDVEIGLTYGLSWIDSTPDSTTLHRGSTDLYWNYVRVRIWKPR